MVVEACLDDDELIGPGGPDSRVVSVRVVAPLRIAVRHADGVEGTVRFEESGLRGVQTLLADPAYFAGVYVSHGAVTWPDEGYDMCPDTMRLEIIAGGGEYLATGPFKYMPEVTNAGRWL